MQRIAMTALVAGSIGLGASVAQAAFVQEYFDYGSTSGNLSMLPPDQRGTATDGWGGAWIGDAGPDYFADRNLTYTATGYSNAGNVAGASGYGGGDAGGIASRLLETPMTGTVWVSALAQVSSNAGDAILWFRNDPHGVNSNFISLRGSANGADAEPPVVLRYGAATNLQSTQTFAVDTTHHLLARITIDYATDLDRIELWVNPDLSGGEAGLGTPLLMGDGVNVLNGVAGPRVSFAVAGSTIDAIRISNDPNGFQQVTAVPEPASLAALGLAAGALLVRRRR